MDEAATTLKMPPGADLAAYKRRADRALRQSGAASIAPGRSPWTARRSCRSACSARSATGCGAGAPIDRLALGVAGLDALRHRHRREGRADRRARSACRNPSADKLDAPAATRTHRGRPARRPASVRGRLCSERSHVSVAGRDCRLTRRCCAMGARDRHRRSDRKE